MNNQVITLGTYQDNFEKYFTETPSVVSGEFKDFFDQLISKISPNAKMLEIGSGTGRDANYFELHGITVIRTDVVPAFIEYQRKNGKTISQLNILSDEIQGIWDIIFANAVFLHFTEVQFLIILKKIVRVLSPDGLLAFTVKTGDGEDWSTHKMGAPRFFKYWTKDELRRVVEMSGFKIIKLESATENTRLFCIATA